MTSRRKSLLPLRAATVAVALAFAGAGCSSDNGSTARPDAPTIAFPDAGTLDAPAHPTDGGDCFAGTPTTHDELINACTTAQKIAHDPTLPLLLDDGGLPAHP